MNTPISAPHVADSNAGFASGAALGVRSTSRVGYTVPRPHLEVRAPCHHGPGLHRLGTPLKAAVHATRVFQHYSAQVGRDGETRGVMEHFATALRPKADLLDDVGLVPEEAVFHGFRRQQPA